MPTAPKPHRPAGTPERGEARGSASARGYGRRWQRESAAWIAEQISLGKCECADCGKVIIGGRRDIHVDHKVPTQGEDDPMHYLRSNWQMMHKKCHSKKTRRDTANGMTRR